MEHTFKGSLVGHCYLVVDGRYGNVEAGEGGVIFHHGEGILDEEEVEEENVEGEHAYHFGAYSVAGVRRFLKRVQHVAFMFGCLVYLGAAECTASVIVFRFFLAFLLDTLCFVLFFLVDEILLLHLLYHEASFASLVFLLLDKFFLVQFHLLCYLIADLDLLLKIFEHSAFVQEDFEG